MAVIRVIGIIFTAILVAASIYTVLEHSVLTVMDTGDPLWWTIVENRIQLIVATVLFFVGSAALVWLLRIHRKQSNR